MISLRLQRGDKSFAQQLTYHAGTHTFEGQLYIPHVELWWPHTHGEPCLYRATLQINSAGVDAVVETVLDLGAIGFRTVSLKTQDDSFVIEVNGAPVFCRGAVWTPLDPVSLRSSPEQCQAAVAQVRLAGMNMLRVAGTMVYEEPHFFDACDAQGILVWQDFMFANMDYPSADESFMDSIALEVSQQLKMLRNRPCLTVLCGNSEVEQQSAMWGAPGDVWCPSLFTNVIAQFCAQYAPSVPYWPSSAHGGTFPHQANAGTSSYYGVGAYLRPLEDARHSGVKFATECLAFANVPGTSTIQRMPGGMATRVHDASWKARSPRDLNAGWDFDDVRDHYFERLFQTNSRQLRRCDHDRYLTWSRMASGEVMAASMAEWRRPASGCKGAMVLFLRDLWAGAGWGLVDDKGQPKACYHYLKRALQPCTVLLTDEGVNGLWIHLLNEQPRDESVVLELTAWQGGDVQVAQGCKALTLPARSAQSVSALDFLGAYFDLTHACQFGPQLCDAVVVSLKGANGLSADAFYFVGGLKTTQEPDVGLCAQATLVDQHTAVVAVKTKRFAHGVHFDVPGFQADDDFFHLSPECETRVTLRSTSPQAFSGQVIAANSMRQATIELLQSNHTQ
jgi:beta-mannosidase